MLVSILSCTCNQPCKHEYKHWMYTLMHGAGWLLTHDTCGGVGICTKGPSRGVLVRCLTPVADGGVCRAGGALPGRTCHRRRAGTGGDGTGGGTSVACVASHGPIPWSVCMAAEGPVPVYHATRGAPGCKSLAPLPIPSPPAFGLIPRPLLVLAIPAIAAPPV